MSNEDISKSSEIEKAIETAEQVYQIIEKNDGDLNPAYNELEKGLKSLRNWDTMLQI
jgi:exonuclease VII small subunit